MPETLEDIRDKGSDNPDEPKVCHLVRDAAKGPICGAIGTPTHRSERMESVPDHCPVCGNPVCPACKDIWKAYQRSNVWEGP